MSINFLQQRRGKWSCYIFSIMQTYSFIFMYVWLDSFIYLWLDSFIRVTWLFHFVCHKSCHTYTWVMPHIWMSHVTHMNESCLTYEWVMSHIWMSHVTWLIHFVRHKSRLLRNGLYLHYTYEMTHWYVWNISFMHLSWHMCIYRFSWGVWLVWCKSWFESCLFLL